MRLTSLEARNVLSFAEFEMDLDPRRTVIVGPNGSGKTNLTRLLALMGAALAWVETEGPRGAAVPPGAAAQILDGYARARHFPDNGGRQAVHIGLELTAEWERALMVAFVRAAVLSTVQEDLQQGQQHQDGLAEWVMATVTPAACGELFSGTLVAEHSGVPGMAWEVAFEFIHGAAAERYRWILQAQRWHSTIMASATAMSPPPGLTTGRGALAQQIVGWTPGSPPLTSLPSLLPFSLDILCRPPGEAVDVAAGASNQYLDPGVAPYRDFLQLARLATSSPFSRRLSLGAALWPIWHAGLVLVGEQLRGVGTWGAALPPTGTYPWEDLASPSVSRLPHLLPLRLLRLKTGSAEERHRYQRVQKAFGTLAPGRQFDLQFEAVSGQRQDAEASVAAEARIEVMVTKARADQSLCSEGPSAEFPIQLHGAGTWEALILAEALNDAADHVVVLDEPATTLHPTWQRGLATQLDQSDGQLLLVTHSSDLVRIRDQVDLSRVVRLTQQDGATLVKHLAVLPQEPVLLQVLRELALSVELRSCLFARAVVLLEGETELGVLPRWFARCARDTGSEPPESLDLAFYQVGGDAGFAAPLALLAGLGIPWAVICDGAAFDVTHQRNHIFEQVKRAGAGTSLAEVLSNSLPAAMDAETFGRLVTAGRNHGVLTVASGWTVGGGARQCSQPAARAGNEPTGEAAPAADDESFEAFLDRTLPGARDEAKKEAPKSKVRQGLWISDQYAPPKEIGELYQTLIAGLRAHGLSIP